MGGEVSLGQKKELERGMCRPAGRRARWRARGSERVKTGGGKKKRKRAKTEEDRSDGENP